MIALCVPNALNIFPVDLGVFESVGDICLILFLDESAMRPCTQRDMLSLVMNNASPIKLKPIRRPCAY